MRRGTVARRVFSWIVEAVLLAQVASIGPAFAQTPPPPAGDYVIKNRWKPSQILNIQNAQPQASPASDSSLSAQWALEPTGAENFIRLRNRGTGLYLHAEGGQPQAAAVPPEQPSAQWSLEYLSGVPDPRIKNRATGGYLHINDGPLVVGDASPEWGTAFWKLVPVGVGTYLPPPVQGVVTTDGISPPPQVACAGKWIWSGGKHICVPSCPPGWHPVGAACVKNCPPGWHPAGGTCVKNCLPGWHPVGGMCVKNCPPGWHPVGSKCVKNCPPGWHPVGNICVPNCPPGWHLSLGHCCPAGKNWKFVPAPPHCG